MSFELVNDDCLHYLKSMPENVVDLVVTSPPYNCGIDYDAHNDNMPFDEYVSCVKRRRKDCLECFG